ncbi:MAG: type VII secretion integral membrane protein EccD [Micromonosporaceae bacterium]
MSTTSGADLCRVTVVGPRRRVDIVLPAYVPFAELFPTVLRYAGSELANAGLAHGGWVLQRLGQQPFHPGMTPQQVGLRDGEMVYLRPRLSQLPQPRAFDDVADVIATGVNERPDRWSPQAARDVSLGGAALALTAVLAALLASGPPWRLPAVTAGVIAAVLLITAMAVSRAAGDSRAGAVLGYLAMPYGFVAGLLGPARSAGLTHLGAQQLLPAFAALVFVAAIAGVAVADGLPAFFGAGGAALLGTIAVATSLALGNRSGAAGPAAITVAVALALTPLIPAITFRMARVTLPPVPRNADDMRRDSLMVDGKEVLERTAVADRFVTGIISGIALVAVGAEISLAFGKGLIAHVMCAVVASVLLLRSRVFRGLAQRLWLMIPGFGALALLAAEASLHVSQQTMILAVTVGPLLVGAAIVVGVGLWLPNHRPSPFWGRAADIIDMMLIVSLIPLALGVAGVFGAVRGLAG